MSKRKKMYRAFRHYHPMGTAKEAFNFAWNHSHKIRAELAGQNYELKARVEELEKVGEAMKADLLMRADVDSEGVKVVACGATVWRNFCAALQGDNDV